MSGHSLDCATQGGPGVACGPCDCGAEREAASKPALRVVQLYERSLRDVPAQLRHMADDIEAGRVAGRSAVLVVETGPSEVDVWAWGDTDNWRCAGMLALASNIAASGDAPMHLIEPSPEGAA
jgi:hypothetical protein